MREGHRRSAPHTARARRRRHGPPHGGTASRMRSRGRCRIPRSHRSQDSPRARGRIPYRTCPASPRNSAVSCIRCTLSRRRCSGESARHRACSSFRLRPCRGLRDRRCPTPPCSFRICAERRGSSIPSGKPALPRIAPTALPGRFLFPRCRTSSARTVPPPTRSPPTRSPEHIRASPHRCRNGRARRRCRSPTRAPKKDPSCTKEGSSPCPDCAAPRRDRHPSKSPIMPDAVALFTKSSYVYFDLAILNPFFSGGRCPRMLHRRAQEASMTPPP